MSGTSGNAFEWHHRLRSRFLGEELLCHRGDDSLEPCHRRNIDLSKEIQRQVLHAKHWTSPNSNRARKCRAGMQVLRAKVVDFPSVLSKSSRFGRRCAGTIKSGSSSQISTVAAVRRNRRNFFLLHVSSPRIVPTCFANDPARLLFGKLCGANELLRFVSDNPKSHPNGDPRRYPQPQVSNRYSQSGTDARPDRYAYR